MNDCAAYGVYSNNIATISASDYTCQDAGPLGTITVTANTTSDTPTLFKVETQAGGYTITIDPNNNWTGTLSAPSLLLDVRINGDTGGYITACIEDTPTFIPNATQQIITIGPISYYLSLFTCNASGAASILINYSNSFQTTSVSNGTLTTLQSPPILCPCKCPNSSCPGTGEQLIEIPDITIISQTTLNGENIGEVDFIIRDTIDYHCKTAIGYCKSRSKPLFNLITTCFQQFSPPFFNVLKGDGCTVSQKILSINPSANITYVVTYGLLKYILYYVLYGKFNINALLNKNNERLLNKIAESRFCKFADILRDSNGQLSGSDHFYKCDYC